MADDDWGGWDANCQRRLVAGLAVSAEERLAWVEEMLELALKSGAIPKPRDEWGQPIDPHELARTPR